MSVRATEAVWSSSTLPRRDGAFRLLLALAERASNDGVAWPGRDELVERLAVTDRHVRRCIAAATSAGELAQRTAADGRVVFRLTLPGLDDVDRERLERHGLELAEPFDAGHARPRRRTPMSEKPDVHVRPTRARSSSRTVIEPSASGGSAPAGATAQDLVAFYVDETRRRGAEPLSKLVGHIGREAKHLLDDGATADEIRAGLKVLVAKGLHPSTLASCVQEQRLRKPRTRGGTDADYDAYDRAGL